MHSKFGFGKVVDVDFDTAIERVTEELEKEGFGVLSDIDVADKLKTKIGVDMKPYRILGACNPPLAHKAIQTVHDIGLLLPCNVLVRETDAGDVIVSFMDPASVMSLVDHPDMPDLASDVKKRLERVQEAL